MGLKIIGGTWQLVWKVLLHSAHCSEAPAERHTAQSSTSTCGEHSELPDCEGEAAAGGAAILRHLWIDCKSNMMSLTLTEILFKNNVEVCFCGCIQPVKLIHDCSDYTQIQSLSLKGENVCMSYAIIYLYKHTAECRAYLVFFNLLKQNFILLATGSYLKSRQRRS